MAKEDPGPRGAPEAAAPEAVESTKHPAGSAELPPEIGGAPGPEPTRYGDWEHRGRCTDF